MFKYIYALLTFSILSVAPLKAECDYDIMEIGTTQAKTSQGIGINAKGQILGFYNIDNTATGKHFFVREKNDNFIVLPEKDLSTQWLIEWRFIKDDGKVYGTYDGNSAYSVLFVWDRNNGVTNLGNLPNKNFVTINNSGQVLLSSVSFTENGKTILRPVVWTQGQQTAIYGLESNVGIVSDTTYASDMNDKGEVVGRSLVYTNHKNQTYSHFHAFKWSKGNMIDLHVKVPKCLSSHAKAINNRGDMLIATENSCVTDESPFQSYFMEVNYGHTKCPVNYTHLNENFIYNEVSILNRTVRDVASLPALTHKAITDKSLWIGLKKIVAVNDSNQVIAQGVTIYGEEHVMLLTPINKL